MFQLCISVISNGVTLETGLFQL